MKAQIRLPLVWGTLFACAVLLYGHSFRHEFVYDDHTRIELNPAVKTLSDPARFFTDRTTQASVPELCRDNYRPLTTLSFAADYFLWGLHPSGYHIENVLIHGLNAGLVSSLSVLLFEISPVAAGLGGLFFLIHPVQTESVAWISGRSNVLFLLLMLLSLICWEKARNKKFFLIPFFVTFVAGLFSRENFVGVPLILVLNDLWANRSIRRPWFHKVRWDSVAATGLLSMGYVTLRFYALDQLKQSSYWGGSVWSNLANVFQISPLYFRTIIWPRNLRMTYSNLDVLTNWESVSAWAGLAIAAVSFFIAAKLRKKIPAVSYGLILIVILWLPGSNLIPLTTLFAERLLYPMMIAPAFLLGCVAQTYWPVSAHSTPWKKGLAWGLGSFYFLFLAGMTRTQIPVWKNDYTLWSHATRVNPEGWFGWYSLGLVARQQASIASSRSDATQEAQWTRQAEVAFRSALAHKPPIAAGAEIFGYLAQISEKNGHPDEAHDRIRRSRDLASESENLTHP